MTEIRWLTRRAVWMLTIAAIALLCANVPAPGVAEAAPESGNVLLGSAGPPPGVEQRQPAPAPAARTAPVHAEGEQPMLTLRQTGSTPVAQPEGELPGGYYCTEKIDHYFHGRGEDEFLEETGGVDYYAQVDCNFYLASMEGIAGVLDRSDSFNGESFDGRVLGTGTYFYREWAYTGNSLGGLGFRARNYNGARKVEPAFELYLLAPEGLIWGECNPIPGLRYLVCEGLGTSYLHVVMGKGALSTGLTKACRDQRAALDPEQARLVTPLGGTVPASTLIIRLNTGIKDRVVTFKRDLCGQTSSAAAMSFASERGRLLWEAAVTAARAGGAASDDRPLYWARLSMTAAFSQWRPSFGVDRDALQLAVDRASRGMTSHDFTTGTARKVFISGFDPFDLDGGNNILRGNPSGAAVLKLDGLPVGGAEVQAVIFPVRYQDFDGINGLVEQVFTRHVAPGPQQASLITTVSQGGGRFDLEFYNGRRRSSTAPDNRNQQGGGSDANPIVPAMGPGEEFLQTTLPVDRMITGTPYLVEVNTAVREKVTSAAPSTSRDDGPTLGSIAVRGSGGGYLSNEIAYRVTRLRGAAGTLPAGHVHTPTLRVPTSVSEDAFNRERNDIATQYQRILEAAIAAPAVPPVRITADRSTYSVGDRPQYSVLGGPTDDIKWTSVLNGAVTSEVDAFHGHRTDAAGTWSGSYHNWAQAGTWTKWVRVDGRLASVTVTVNPATPAPPRTTADFDGDRRTDVSVWRPGDGTWYVLPSGGGGYTATTWGVAGDLPVEADFDGDGHTDRAVFRPAEGTWYLLQSTEGIRVTNFGLNGDIPVPGDFDGDQRGDIAVWRPSDGTWYVLTSGGSYYGVQFGTSGDRVVPGDYDGDRRTDVAVFRPSTGQWIIMRSSDGQVEWTSWGVAEDRPVAADYDADGRTDLAVFRPSTGQWYIWPSGGGPIRIEGWGYGSDVVTPGDFDGDGTADFAVFRPSDGAWHVRPANGGPYQYYSFGLAGDVPVPGVNLTR